MDSSWHQVLEISYIFIFMFIAKVIKEKLGLFKSIVIPTSLLGGFLGLIFGPDVLGSVHIHVFGKSIPLGFPYDQNFYTNIIFYFMIIGFVSLTLTERRSRQNRLSFDSGLFIAAIYVLQAILGMGTIYLMLATFWPDIITAGLGLFLPLAFASGPGLAGPVGASWDVSLGVNYIQQFGLTLSAVGFVVGGVVGVALLNYYIRKYNLTPVKLRDLKGLKSKNVEFTTLEEFNFFDNLLVQVSWLGLIMFITFVIAAIIWNALSPLGKMGQDVAGTIIGLSYMFGVFIALGLRGLLRYIDSKGHRTQHLIDDYMMNNISSFALNVMITASIMSIRIGTIQEYWPILLTVSIVGTIGTFFYVTRFGRYIYGENNPLHYILAIFGMQTGIAATGVALLRGVDPNLETDVSDNAIVLGSAIATPFAMPLIIVLSFPLLAITKADTASKIFGINIYEFLTPAILVTYFILLTIFLVLRVRSHRRKAQL